MVKVSMSYLFSFSQYQTKCLIKFLFRVDDVIKFKTYLQTTSKAMADREKKKGKREIQKFKYLENEKSFCDEIKNIFHSI